MTIAALAIATLLGLSGMFGAGCGGGGGGDNDNAPRSCGDGVLDDDETCDDGNDNDGDGCSHNCLDECRINGDLTTCPLDQLCCTSNDNPRCLPIGDACVP